MTCSMKGSFSLDDTFDCKNRRCDASRDIQVYATPQRNSMPRADCLSSVYWKICVTRYEDSVMTIQIISLVSFFSISFYYIA
jgi:hypothetical protein